MNLTKTDYAAITCACGLSLALFYRQRTNRHRLPLPNGPPSWPLIGAFPYLATDVEIWRAFEQWGEKYGDVCYARLLNQDMIILNSYEAAVELLDRKSAVYSGRPRATLAADIVGWDRALGILPYGDRMRRTRRMLQEGMSIRAMPDLWPMQEQEAIKFVRRLLDTPQEFQQHIRQTAGAMVLKLTYGYDVEDRNDRFLALANNAMEMFSLVTTPGTLLVDIFPWLQYMPWLRTRINEWRKLLVDFVEIPMQQVYEKMKTENGEPYLVSRWIERERKGNEQPEEVAEYNRGLVKWAALSLYGGGSDTTVSAIASFFAAMVQYPKVQAKAQAEIARVIGTDRLPTYTDRSSLPYVEALYKEILRCYVVVPIGLPHRLEANEDDMYRGMRIPSGATVFANIWRMLHDPDIYCDPMTFNPERFMESTEIKLDPEEIAFGFGRRRCPGVNVAHSSIWLSIALTLATYSITPALGPNGRPILPSSKRTNGSISHPESFECTITPRSSKAISLVREASEQ